MEVRRPFSDPEHGHEVDFTRGNRDAIARAAERARELEAAQRERRAEEGQVRKREEDRVELGSDREAEDAAAAARVAALRELHGRGELNTPERIERAAGNMLGA